MLKIRTTALLLGASAIALATAGQASAADFNIPQGQLDAALDSFMAQSGVVLMVPNDAVRGVRTKGVKGEYPAEKALASILRGTGFTSARDASGIVAIVREQPRKEQKTEEVTPVRLAAAASAGVETVVVTSSKIKGDIQTVPIAITALSQEQLTSRQIAGGPDLVKEVPNLTFSKTNFTGYNIEIRGIGTQAISVTTDPAVAVAFNDTPFIRNHFFEQEFYDVAQVEVLRGPQGTLYGRNATAGVVNVVSAKPTDQFEAMLSADWGNFHNRRYEGMVNLPIVGDKLDLRIAGEWTKRDGYTFNETTGKQTDGRNLWSTRITLGWKPTSAIEANFIWEHFRESDDRLRSGKQLCKTDPGVSQFSTPNGVVYVDPPADSVFNITSATFSQGCLPSSMYSKGAFGVPNGFSLPFISGAAFEGLINTKIDPYQSTTQSTNLRDIQSELQPKYLANNDTLEFNASWNISPSLALSSDTGYNRDFLWSSEDYNRFDTSPGIFLPNRPINTPYTDANGFFCDPQLGCSNRLVVQDLSTEHAWQLSQELRLASDFEGPLNFSIGGNYLHYETTEKYYVFSNTFTMISLNNICPGLPGNPGLTKLQDSILCLPNGRSYSDPADGGGIPTESPQYVDSHPISSLDDEGHNYFVSKNPYVLNSYAAFGEAYYSVTKELKLTAGLRWTDDEKHFLEYPSQLLTEGYGYPTTGTVDQKWKKWTGRFVANWSPKLDFTDQSMFYGSYARGYKAGGANPPGAVLLQYTDTIKFPVHPLTFKPEYIDAFEIGTKNTLLDGGLTLNGDVFFYNYRGYQISEIVDRTSVNLNFDATVRGAELEATWEPATGLKFSFAGGYEDTNIGKNQYAIDLVDRTAGTPGWVLMKPWVGQSSNCIFPTYVAAALVVRYENDGEGNAGPQACGIAYNAGLDPVTEAPYSSGTYPMTLTRSGYPTIIYPGFDPLSVDPAAPTNVNNGLGLPPNNGEGFAKSVSGNELPNAPHYTASLTADYTMPVSANWAATLHGDFYWQSQSWARVFNDRPYDKIRGYSNVNAAVILTDASGWQIMGYVKNIFDTTAITGDFLNSDDSGLTTNIFLTDPRLYGVRVTKHFDGGSDDAFDLFENSGKRPQFWFTVGGDYTMLSTKETEWDPSSEPFFPNGGTSTPEFPTGLPTPGQLQKIPKSGFEWEGGVSYQQQESDWVLKAGIRYGRSAHHRSFHKSLAPLTRTAISVFGYGAPCSALGSFASYCSIARHNQFDDSNNASSEKHTILDFTIGKDVGIGLFGEKGTNTIAVGARAVQFGSKSRLIMGADPVYHFVPAYTQKYHEIFEFDSRERRSFHGIGPELKWDTSQPMFGNEAGGQIAIDMGLNAGILFGRQTVDLNHMVSYCRIARSCSGRYVEPEDHIQRSRSVTVPNLGGYIGASVRYSNAKISLGYRADEFFNAMDGGQATAKKYDRGFYGPYLNLSIGFGG